jgi:hypothetical protein
MKSKVIKRCNTCGRFLSEDDFGWQKDSRQRSGGYPNPKCRRCCRNSAVIFNELNPGYQKQYNKENKKNKKEYDKHSYKNNRQNINERNKQWNKNNVGIRNKIAAKRRAIKLNQTPKLTTIEQGRINFIYGMASTMADYHVDHIQPLSKGGLHHPDNLQILHKDLNLEKNDKYPLTEEEEVKYNGFKL